MKFLENIQEKTLLIIDNNIKQFILEELSQTNDFYQVKIMTQKEFLDHYFFTYSEEAIYYLVKTYQFTVNNAKIYLENLKYVLIGNKNNSKLIFLRKLYEDLKDKNLLQFDPLFKSYLKRIKIITLQTSYLEPFFLNILSLYNSSVKTLELKENIEKNYNIYHFNTIEEECAFVFEEISSLLKQGINIQNIKLTNVCNEYIPFLKRMSYLYHIKINNLENESIYGTIVAKEVIQLIEDNKTKEEILEYLDKYKEKDIYFYLLNLINRYYFVSNLNEVLPLIKEDLKNISIPTKLYEEAISILPLNSYLIKDFDYVFLLGFNLEHLPKTFKDIDYLSDTEKEEIGLFTSIEMNKLTKNTTLFYIKNINNLYITYKDTDPYQSYYISNLYEDLKATIIDNLKVINKTSNLYNQIKLTNQLDNMLKYGTTYEDTSLLWHTYPNIPYLTYNNQFTKISNFKLDKITLSYTSLNNYYHCSYRYYIDNILKLNIYEDSFKTYIGNLFHYVLSKIFEDNFSFLEEFNHYNETKEFTPKELFFLENLKDELEKIIEVIRYQHKLSGLNKILLEKEIKLISSDNHLIFKGFIDKIMYKEKDNQTYLSVIDYKTGTPKTDMTNLLYGIDMQLPVYLYLIKKSNLFLNSQIIGFYFQQIVHEKSSSDTKKSEDQVRLDKLKLIGYTNSDPYLVNMFDETYENSEMIKGMKVTSKGFSHYTKVLTDEEMDKIVDLVDLNIKKAFSLIEKGEFFINPKIIGGENVGCSFCKYQDLCFKNGKDFVYLERQKDLSYLNREGDENA